MTTTEEFVNKDIRTLMDVPEHRTLADTSAAAAQGHTSGVQVIYLDIGTPETKRPASPNALQSLTGGIQILEPPEDPDSMWEIYQLSAFLGPTIDEVVANVYQTGYKFQQIHDFEGEDLKFQVRCALLQEAQGKDVGENAVQSKIDELKRRAELEYGYLDWFHRICVAEAGGYNAHVGMSGQDLEVSGNTYWEILRNKDGAIYRYKLGLSKILRAVDEDVLYPGLQPVAHPILGVRMVAQFFTLRRYVQIKGGQITAFFKDFGDPRIISRRTGEIYPSLDMLYEEEGSRFGEKEPLAANEILHLRIPFAGSGIYGKPSHSGAYPGMKGARDLDEFNKRLVVDEDVPSLLLGIAGPRIGPEEQKAIREQIEQRRKRRGGIVILNVYDSKAIPHLGVSPTPVLMTEKLRSEQTADALFQNYEASIESKVNTAYGLPDVLHGKGITREKVIAAERFAENHVFRPRRENFAQQSSDRVLPAMGVYCWRVVQEPNPPRDPEALAGVLAKLAAYGFITSNEGRKIIDPSLPGALPKLHGPWADLPQKLLTAMLQTKNKELAAVLIGGDEKDVAGLAEKISKILMDGASSDSGSTGGSTSDTGGRYGEDGAAAREGGQDGE